MAVTYTCDHCGDKLEEKEKTSLIFSNRSFDLCSKDLHEFDTIIKDFFHLSIIPKQFVVNGLNR